jgi:hypothetical protein
LSHHSVRVCVCITVQLCGFKYPHRQCTKDNTFHNGPKKRTHTHTLTPAICLHHYFDGVLVTHNAPAYIMQVEYVCKRALCTAPRPTTGPVYVCLMCCVFLSAQHCCLILIMSMNCRDGRVRHPGVPRCDGGVCAS